MIFFFSQKHNLIWRNTLELIELKTKFLTIWKAMHLIKLLAPQPVFQQKGGKILTKNKIFRSVKMVISSVTTWEFTN